MNGSKAVLITNNTSGNHSAADWAQATADHLVHVGPNADNATRLAAMRLELTLIDVLTTAHESVQSAEKSKLSTTGDAHLATDIDPSAAVDTALASVVAAAKGTPFEAHWADPQVQAQLRQVLGSHFGSSIHIERKHHSSRKAS
jgi:hypothetical protein